MDIRTSLMLPSTALALLAPLVARGAEPKKMLTAFPTLEADDIAFAGMFARLNKGPGSASTGRCSRNA